MLLHQIGQIIEEKLEQKLEEKLEQKLEEKLEQKLDEKLSPIHKRLVNLEQDMANLDRKVEALHVYHEKTHSEILNMLVDSNEANDGEVKVLEKRVTRIEKHLNL